MTFNQMPKQCETTCPFTQDQVDKNSVVLTLNCEGPAQETRAYKSTLAVQDGEPVSYDPDTIGTRLGRFACTNKGANLWRDVLETKYIESAESN